MREIKRHIPGLDAIRLICATMVAFSHFSVRFDFTFLGLSAEASRIVNGVILLFSNGPAAVIVFFVISGFVIHLPTVSGKRLDIGEFYARRLIRVVLPTVAFMIMFVALLGSPPSNDWNKTVLWSVFCELAYYSIYPLLILSGVSIRRWIGLSIIAFGLVVVLYWNVLQVDLNYPVFGYGFTWVAGFPLWLAGCWIAENIHSVQRPKKLTLYMLRAMVVGVPAVLQFARFQVPSISPWTSYALTLNVYGILVVAWLAKEIAEQIDTNRTYWLDKLGCATFSMYLVHWFVVEQFPENARGFTMMLIYLALLPVATYIFYRVVEAPSHQLARRLGSHIARRGALGVEP